MTNFERTLRILQERLNERLAPGYSRIWVQGSNKSSVTNLVFTIFPTGNDQYVIKFLEIRNFRNYRPDGNLEEEMNIINRHIDSFKSVLENYIT
jgi:hypothetical protein